MSALREKCEFKDRCGQTGHYRDPGSGSYVRCPCLQQEINKKKLGTFFAATPRADTPLMAAQDTDLLIEGPLATIKNHVAGVLLKRADQNENWITIDAYRLIEIFLDEDSEFDNQAPITETDLLIILLGFGDPRNRYLPELLIQVLSRRELTSKPTWVILGTTLDLTATKYSGEVHDRLRRMRKVNVK